MAFGFTFFFLIFKIIGSHASPSNESNSPFDWKSYLESYGYLEHARTININSLGSDDHIIKTAAIKTFQENFSLKPTGILDNETMSMMKTPRCGIPDIINGTNVMQLHKMRNSSSSSKYATGFTILKWDTYQLNYLLMQNQFSDEPKPALKLAFDEWQTKTNFIFSDTQGFFGNFLSLGFNAREHGDDFPFDGPLGKLAHANFPPGGQAHFDAEEKWFFGTTRGIPANQLDFQSVALHEIGHLLGLHHTTVRSSIMYPKFRYGAIARTLTLDDIAGLEYIYGKQK